MNAIGYDPTKFTMILLPMPLEESRQFLQNDPQSFTMACALSMQEQRRQTQTFEIGNFKELGLATEQRYRRCKKVLEDMGFLALIKTNRNPQTTTSATTSTTTSFTPRIWGETTTSKTTFVNFNPEFDGLDHQKPGKTPQTTTSTTTSTTTFLMTKKTLVHICQSHNFMFDKIMEKRDQQRPSRQETGFFGQKAVKIMRENASHPFRYNIYISKLMSSKYLLSDQVTEPLKAPKNPAAPDPVASAAPSARRKKKLDTTYFCKEEGKFKNLRPAFLETLGEVYAGKVDIDAEFKKMCLWCSANEVKASKKQLWEKFILGWLNRASDQNFNKQAVSFQRKSSHAKISAPVDEERALRYKEMYGF